MVSPLVVCNNFLKRGFEDNIEITPMKLQKLLYFLYARYLNCHKTQLFQDRFEVWKYGPVISEVYDYYKSYKATSIDEFALIDGVIYEVNEDNNIFKENIDLVWEKYGKYNGTYLSNLTHNEGTAWSKADSIGDLLLSDADIMLDGERFFGEC